MLKVFVFKNYKKESISDLLLCLCLIIATLTVYYQVIYFDFINYDTPEYVYDNIHVKQGLTFNGVMWAFSTTTLSNWHPLTWLSHMLDVEFFGLNPGAHHGVNVIFHIINSLLLYLIIKKISGSSWSSWIIASLFALHPLHVQSVVWVAERKDVLSTMFGFLSILFYYYYTKKQKSFYYLLVILSFMLSLLTKPMLVTLPFILLLMDYWPLNRFSASRVFPCKFYLDLSIDSKSIVGLIIEKIPLLLLAATSCIITVYAQRSGGAMLPITEISLYTRLLNIVNSYARYIFLMVYPFELAVIYPYPETLALNNIIFPGLFLICMTCFALWNTQKRPWIFFGWFFFIGTLVPVIGIIQVGVQAMADRYTYVPLIGLFIIITWGIMSGINYFQQFFNLKKPLRCLLSLIIIFFFAVISWNQVGYWKNSIILFSRSLEVTAPNTTAHNNLGHAFLNNQDYDKAVNHFVNAINLNPYNAMAHLNYGFILADQNNLSEAIKHYKIALTLNPDDPKPHINLGNLYYRQNDYAKAIEHYLSAYKLQPLNVNVLNGIGAVMVKKGRIDKGIYFFKRALKIDPYNVTANNNLKKILAARKAEGVHDK